MGEGLMEEVPQLSPEEWQGFAMCKLEEYIPIEGGSGKRGIILRKYRSVQG